MAEPSKTTRRAFLAGQSAADALADALAPPRSELKPPASTIGAQPGSHLLSISREAMACLFEIVYDAAAYRNRTDAAVAALDLVESLEAQLTIYRETSEVARINQLAPRGPVAVEPGLFELLKRAAALAQATQGAFDFTAGRLSKIWGFYRRQGRMPSADEIAEALAGIGADGIEFNDENATVQFLRPGIELNLGAIGKGYTLDRVAQSLETSGICDFLIHGGNSSVLARGKRQAPGWTVALRHPLRPAERLAEFTLRDQALGTSGSGTQFFHHQGRRFGHIIDPRTGWPADQVLSATVIAPTAEQADALSTAFYVSGLERARAYCAAHPEISALFCTANQSGIGIDLHPVHLSDEAWRAL